MKKNTTSSNDWESDTRSGLQTLQENIRSGLHSPMTDGFGIKIVKAELGAVEISAQPSENFLNPTGRIHGGFAATVIDTALGCAVLSTFERRVGFGTVELHVNYVKRIDADTGTMLCRASVLHNGRTMLTAEAKLVDAAGLLYAHGTGTFLVYPK